MGYSDRFELALQLMHQLHKDQIRKGSAVPYVTHLLAVASLVGEHGGSEDQVIAALLHDAVEDQGGAPTAERIREMFGDTVTRLVLSCSDTDVIPKPPWKERKEKWLERLETLEPDVLLVTTADKLHNARSLLSEYRSHGEPVFEAFRGGKSGTLWYFRSVIGILARRFPSAIVGELDRTVKELELCCAAGPKTTDP